MISKVDKIALVSLVVAVLGVCSSLFIPEIRCKLLKLKLDCSSESETQSTLDGTEKSLSFIPLNSNILIFDASNNSEAAQNLEEFLVSNSSLREDGIDIDNEWRGKWIMHITRIYFLGRNNKEIADRLERSLPGDQFVIDYYNQKKHQNESYWPDKPDYASGNMIGFEPNRDIVIFVGNDLSEFNL